MFLLVSKYLIPKGYRAMAIFPFVLLRGSLDKKDKVLLNHERIHLRQQLEMLIIPFYIAYFLVFLVGWIRYKNWSFAYLNSCFEREAYVHEGDLGYLKRRSFWAFLKYV